MKTSFEQDFRNLLASLFSVYFFPIISTIALFIYVFQNKHLPPSPTILSSDRFFWTGSILPIVVILFFLTKPLLRRLKISSLSAFIVYYMIGGFLVSILRDVLPVPTF